MTNDAKQAEAVGQPNAPPTRWFGKVVLGFGLASLLSDAGHEAGSAALPTLLATMAAAPATLGLIEGLADGAVCLAKLFGGSLANRPAWRKPIAVTGYLVTGLSVCLYGLSHHWLHVLSARILGWLFRGLRSPSRSAMLVDAVPKTALGRAVGFHRAMDTVGAIVGPLLASALLLRMPLRHVFYCATVPGVLAALAFLLLVPGQKSPDRASPPSFVRSLAGLPVPFRRFLWAVLAFGCGDFARTLLILRATQLLSPLDVPGGAATVAILLFSAHHAVAAVCALAVGYWVDARPAAARVLLAVGYGLGVVTALVAAVGHPSVYWLVVLFVAAGMVTGIEETLESVLCARLVPQSLRGTAFGALSATNGLGDLVASCVVGLLWAYVGPQVAFGSAAVACALGTVLLVAVLGPTEPAH